MSVLRLERTKKENGVVGKLAVFKLLFYTWLEPVGFVFVHSVCCVTAAGWRAGPAGSGQAGRCAHASASVLPAAPGLCSDTDMQERMSPSGQEAMSLFKC